MRQDFLDAAIACKFYICPDRDENNPVIWTDKGYADSYQNYRPNSGRDITDIPLIEIKNAVMETLKEQFSIDMDTLSLMAAKKLGYRNRGANVIEALNASISQLLKDGTIKEMDGKLHFP